MKLTYINFKFYALIVLFLFPAFFSLSAQGVTPPLPPQNRIDEIDKDYDRFQQEQREDQRLSRQKAIEKEPAPVELYPSPPPKISNLGRVEGVDCFELETINIEGAVELSEDKRKEILKPFYGKCITSPGINKLLETITNWYIDNGFVTTRIYIPEQNIKHGTLTLIVIEGTVQAVIQNDNSFGDRLEVYTSFPLRKDRKLNMRDIEQGLDQINKVPSNNAETKILPGDEPGASIIKVVNKQDDKFRAYVELSNSLNSNGSPKVNLRAEKDNLFHLNEQIQYIFGTGVEKSANEDINRNHALYFTIPASYLTFRPSYSYYKSFTNLNIADVKYPYESFTSNVNFYVDYVLARWKTSVLTLSAGLIYKDKNTYFADALLYALSRRTSNMEYALGYTDRFSSGFYDLKFSIVQGTGLFGVPGNDPVNTGPEYPKPRFVKYLLDYSVCKYFDNRLKFCSNGRLQLSDSTLYSEEQIGIGDRYTVRGFNRGFFLGDNGFYIRNELALPFYYMGKSEFLRAIWSPELFVGLDLGYAAKKGGSTLYGNQNDALLSGLSFGFRNNAKWFNLSLILGLPIAQPKFIWDLEGSGLELYANLTVKCF